MTNEELAVEIKNGNTQYMEQLWLQCKRFIGWRAEEWAKHHSLVSVDVDDLIQSGYFALTAAVKYFDPDTGYTFLTYLSNTLMTHFGKTAGIRFGESKELWKRKNKVRNPVSLDEPLGTSSDDGEHCLGDILSGGNKWNPEYIIISRDYAKRLHLSLRKVIREVLTPEERKVVVALYGNPESWSGLFPRYQEFTPKLCMAADDIQRIHHNAVRKLNHYSIKEARKAARQRVYLGEKAECLYMLYRERFGRIESFESIERYLKKEYERIANSRLRRSPVP